MPSARGSWHTTTIAGSRSHVNDNPAAVALLPDRLVVEDARHHGKQRRDGANALDLAVGHRLPGIWPVLAEKPIRSARPVSLRWLAALLPPQCSRHPDAAATLSFVPAVRWSAKETRPMPARLLRRLIARGRAVVHRLRDQLMAATRPATAPVAAGALVDLARSQVGPAGRERAPAPAARHPAAERQATALHARRPGALGAPGQPHSRLAARAADRPAGDAAALASRSSFAGTGDGNPEPLPRRTARPSRPRRSR